MVEPVEVFSDGYFALNVATCQYSGKSVVVDRDLYEYLQQYVSAPLIKAEDEHYWATPEWGVPPGTVAFPDKNHRDSVILLAKDKTATRLVESGEEQAPTYVV